MADGKTKAIKGQVISRHEKVQQLLSENPRLPLSKALLQAGYSKEYSKTPNRFKAGQAWQIRVEKHLPDDEVLGRHKELLRSKSDKVSLGAVELAYKVKHKMRSDGEGVGTQVGEEIREVIFRTRRLLPDSEQ